MKFQETSRGTSEAHAAPQGPPAPTGPVHPDAIHGGRAVPDSRDHWAWAEWHAEEAVAYIRRAVAHPDVVGEDLHMNQAVRSTRAALARALKAGTRRRRR